MEKPIVTEIYADNGELSHYHLINPETGEVLWSSFPEETIARGEKIVSPKYGKYDDCRGQGLCDYDIYDNDGNLKV